MNRLKLYLWRHDVYALAESPEGAAEAVKASVRDDLERRYLAGDDPEPELFDRVWAGHLRLWDGPRYNGYDPKEYDSPVGFYFEGD